MASGIYKIENKTNGLVYIGQSKNIEKRLADHKRISYSPKAPEYNNQIHTAIRKYGIDNFIYSTIEECPINELNNREKYWVKYYDSYINGYNGTEGGDFSEVDNSGEHNGRAYMTQSEVEYIRECYNSHIAFRYVYEKFKHKATKRCIQKIWHFDTWPNIHPEYNTLENKLYHSTAAKANPPEIARNNKRAFSKEEVIAMRQRFANGETAYQIWKTTYNDKALSTIRNIINKVTYKDVE